jgi:histone-lysine N-methyltransferase SUV39H
MSSDEDAPAVYARPSRLKRVIRSPNEAVSDSDAKEEREVYKAVLQGASLSSNEARNIDEDEALIPAMRTNSSSPDLIPPLRASPASSPSEPDNLVPFTDAESPPDSSPSPGPEGSATVSLTYGGFKALTWENHKKDFKNLGLTHYSAKDLPTALPDSVNRLSEYTRRNPGLRDVFRAYMLENIMDDEANAPDIEVINNVDLEPTPLFEFVYSNRIWYGEGVPLPDYSKLKGCGCIGKCDPKSKTCLCAQRQRKYCDMEDGYVYDKFGRLKHPGYPIFECNEMCSCDDECRNRVGIPRSLGLFFS